MGKIVRMSASATPASFDDTAREQQDLSELFQDFDSGRGKYNRTEEQLRKDVTSLQSSLEGRISEMEQKLGVRFDHKVWINSVDTLMAEELRHFYGTLRRTRSQEQLDSILEIQKQNLLTELKKLEGEVSGLLDSHLKQHQNPDFQQTLSEQETQDFLLQTHQVLYEPLQYIDAVAPTPEKEIQYRAYTERNEFHCDFPKEFKQLLTCMLDSNSLKDRLNSFGMQLAVEGVSRLLEKKKNKQSSYRVESTDITTIAGDFTEHIR